eukprot:scaffold2550_cov137-Skeletonema_marinoi.AAC.3
MYLMRRRREGAERGLTEEGERVFNSNEAKYPLGVAIERRGTLLAGCSSGAKAAKLLKCSLGYPYAAIRLGNSIHGFTLRYSTNDDSFGVNETGRAVLPGWTNSWKD